MNIRRSGETFTSGVLSFAKNKRNYLLALSVAIVFVTTYLLILPAMTLDEQEAEKQGGIDVPKQEQVVSEEKADKEVKTPTATMDKVNDSKTETKAAEADTPAEDPADEETDQIAEEASEEPAFASGELTFEGEGFTVAAAFDEEAGLPEDTDLTATEITKDDEDYKAWHDEALKALQKEDGGKTPIIVKHF